ncbi:putative cuticle collagen 99 isoform X7 [Aquila chrysaetos chrysaetos]|uniref:putative cuticle collagen 99 isoform X7 n=1 Tax=Aquila chrysaetos chrysaetos TaxID=223781 RepID=UPI001B7D2C2F|nr:putative cuticle collagen 99 isoform X7 [Aquila chrysaetos chrysaetos]
MCSLVLLLLQLGADPAGAFSSLGPGPGRAFGKMFSPAGCRREFLGCSREPGPWQTGPPPPSHAHGPQDVWDKPPWEHQHRRGRGGWCPRGPWDPRPFPGPADFHGNKEGRWAPHDCPPSPSWDDREDRGGPEDFFGEGWHRPGPWDPRPFPGPADFHGNEEDRRWATHNRAPPPPWDDREDNQGPEDYFGEDWDQPGPWDPRPFPGPPDFHGNEEDRRWAPHDRHPPPHWNDREENQGPEDCFGEGWHREPWSGPSCFAWSEFPGEEQHPPWPPASLPGWVAVLRVGGPCSRGVVSRGAGTTLCSSAQPRGDAVLKVALLRGGGGVAPETPSSLNPLPWGCLCSRRERGGFQDGCPSWGYHGLGGKRGRRLRRGHRELTLVQRFPCSWLSRGNRPFCKSSHSLPGTSQPGVKEQQHSASPQPLMSCKGDVLSTKHTAQGPPAASKKVPEPPGPASSPQKSPATDPRAATEAAEPEQAAEAASVEPGARQKPAGSHSQVETALETEPAPPEKSPAGTGEQLEVEPCSQSVPKAGADGGSHPHSPTAPPEPAEKVHATAGSAGEAGAELCPCSGGEQHLQDGAEEAKGEAACDELLGVLQPSDNSQVPPGATVEPDAQPSQACSDICAAPETSPGTQHPPGSGETEPAADSQHQLCSTLPTPSPASTDLRSAAVLARKEEIELSYQQFSLTIAVVATMLLQKEPSMEPALGLALRANLRQGRIHHLQELEDFINSYDSATLSR